MNKRFLTFLLAALLIVPAASGKRRDKDITVAVFSLNDFHGGFVRNDSKNVPGVAAIWQTVDSLKQVYPHHVTVSAGDIFGGSYFYKATHGVLLPVFFNDLGIRLSAVGNHEFDDGQAALARKWRDTPLRPAGWDITYVCANVRDTAGHIPAFAQPFASVVVPVDKKRTVRLGFVGLLTSSTPLQASKSKLVGLTFDGNYPAVLDSVKRLAGYDTAVAQANIRLLLTHIGTEMEDGHPVWNDLDADHLTELNDPTWHAFISAHSHRAVIGKINDIEYPIAQGKWHGEYISVFKFHLDPRTLKVRSVETELCPVNPNIQLAEGPQRLQAQVDSLLNVTKTDGGAPIGQQLTYSSIDVAHDRENSYSETLVGRFVCRAYAEAYREAVGAADTAIVVGVSHFGSIRAGIVKGPVSVLDVGEILPFSNPLRAFRVSGRQLRELTEFGYHNTRYGWMQSGWLSAERNAEGHVTSIAYVSPNGERRAIADDTPCIVVADEFMVNGGDGYGSTYFPASQDVTPQDIPATTDAFINYLKTFKTLPVK